MGSNRDINCEDGVKWYVPWLIKIPSQDLQIRQRIAIYLFDKNKIVIIIFSNLLANP